MVQACFAVVVDIRVEPADLGRFLDLIHENAAASVRDEPGCLQFDVLRPVETPGTGAPHVLLYELYADIEAFTAHLATPHYAAFDTATRSMLTSKTVMTYSATMRHAAMPMVVANTGQGLHPV